MGQKSFINSDIFHHLNGIKIMAVTAVGHLAAKQNNGYIHPFSQRLCNGNRIRQYGNCYVLRHVFGHIISNQRCGNINDILIFYICQRSPGNRQIVRLYFFYIYWIISCFGIPFFRPDHYGTAMCSLQKPFAF